MVKENWVVYPGGLGLLVHPTFRADMREIAGCADTIYLYVTEYEAHKNPKNTKIVASAISIIHEYGLRVILATDLGGILAGIYPDTYHLLHPETWVKHPEGKITQGCCVNNSEFLSYAKGFYAKLLDDFRVDGISFDEPQPYTCVCHDCCAKFSETVGGNLIKASQNTSRKFAED